jgi:hypothetical protein
LAKVKGFELKERFFDGNGKKKIRLQKRRIRRMEAEFSEAKRLILVS